MSHDRRHRDRAFTLTELLIAVAVLVVVLLAVGRIFTTTTQVTGMGKATSDIMQEVSAIERHLRDDFREMASEGVLAIRCVAVPNDFHGAALLNPALPRDAYVRCDQIVLFTNNVQTPQLNQLGSFSEQAGQSLSARVYYGHAFQLGEVGLPVQTAGALAPRTYDPTDDVYPWTNSVNDGAIDMALTQYSYVDPDETDMFTWETGGTVNVAQVDARQWLLVRQSVMLADDDSFPFETNHKTVYLGNTISARSVFQFLPGPAAAGGGTRFPIVHGRVEAAATLLDEIRRMITTDLGSGAMIPWDGPPTLDHQRQRISVGMLSYPRAERSARSMHRLDQALVNNVISTACSSVRIDWTWEPSSHYVYDTTDPWLIQNRPQPWFGMPDPAIYADTSDVEPDRSRGVGMFGDPEYAQLAGYDWDPMQIDPDLIERVEAPNGIVLYEAIFGYNRSDPSTLGASNPDYTPWPSAVRITLTLHDAETTLQSGREVQFVLKLPRFVE